MTPLLARGLGMDLASRPALPALLPRRVYQKAYLELFVSPEQLKDLIPKLQVR